MAGGVTALTVNNRTGAISVAMHHDYEATPQVYVLNVSLTDSSTATYSSGPLTTFWPLTLSVLDSNDAPELSSVVYFNVTENVPGGTPVYTVLASDQDPLDSCTYRSRQ
jgi:hypothetical protein